jgi:DNA-directed RNA polymerase alpha subunit
MEHKMETITAYKTEDGSLFSTIEAALEHEFIATLTPKLDAFSESPECPYSKGPENMQMRTSITAWEIYRRPTFVFSSIDRLGLTVRTQNCLLGAGVRTIGDLIGKTKNDLYKVKDTGPKSINEIADALREWGLELKAE